MSKTAISEEQAIEIATKHGFGEGLEDFVAENAVLEDGKWRVFLELEDVPLGMPGFVVVEVDIATGEPSSRRSL